MKRIFWVAAVAFLVSCGPPSSPPNTPPEPKADPPKVFQLVELATGTGDAIVAGKVAVVHYTGWLFDDVAQDHRGKKFDSSRDRGEPFRFPVGGGRVIKGWDEGVLGMQVGGQRRLTIPPEKGYGARGAGDDSPPNSTLLFEVELLAIE